jgi:hypothetical protein
VSVRRVNSNVGFAALVSYKINGIVFCHQAARKKFKSTVTTLVTAMTKIVNYRSSVGNMK